MGMTPDEFLGGQGCSWTTGGRENGASFQDHFKICNEMEAGGPVTKAQMGVFPGSSLGRQNYSKTITDREMEPSHQAVSGSSVDPREIGLPLALQKSLLLGKSLCGQDCSQTEPQSGWSHATVHFRVCSW